MPRTLAQNAQYIAETIKPAIKSAIEAQGVTVPSTDSFLDYADRIAEIEGGGSGYQLKDLPTGSISTVSDAAPLPLNALKVSVEAWQEGSGTPSPSNIRPIIGWDSGEISVVEKNLLNNSANNLESGSIDGNVGWNVSSTTRVRNTIAYPFPLDDLIDNGYTWTIPSGFKMAIRCYDKDENYITMSGSYIGFTSVIPPELYGKGVKYVRFVFAKTNDTTITVDEVVNLGFQIEFGTTATTYEPYQGKQYTLDFPQTIYGAEWNVVDGVLDNTKGHITIDGNTTITQRSAGSVSYYIAVHDMAKLSGYSYAIICDRMKPVTNQNMIDSNPFCITGYYDDTASYPNQNWIYINAGINNTADMKTWLANNPIDVVYKLATPTTIDLSPLSIRLLEGTNNLYADCGEVIEGEYFIGETKAYDLVEYIESDGTQVIDTGRQVVQGQTIEVTFEGSSNQTAYAWIFGGITSSDYYGYQFPNSNAVYLYNGGTSASSQSGFSSDVLTQKALTFNGSANANIHILGLWDGSVYSNQGKFKVYFLDINGDYFVPAKRRSDGVYGLYDIANSQFLTDVASGNALTGGESLGIRIG